MLLPTPADTLVARPPKGHYTKIDFWIDEQIWGHRIYPQTPWLMFLECLTVAEYFARKGTLLNEQGSFYPLVFYPLRRMHLRNILWNNDIIKTLEDDKLDSNSSWAKWLAWMQENARNLTVNDFSYLKGRFERFSDFAFLVGMLRDASVESESNKRWTSRFLFPFGANAIYEDLGLDGKHDYTNFTRTGELLYLMLCRSSVVNELRPYLLDYLRGDNEWNQLLTVLEPEIEESKSERAHSYLPYSQHPCFNALGEDWLHLFQLGLPNFDVLSHLVTLSAFHVLLYQLKVAAEWANKSEPITFLCEVVAPKKTLVREVSIINFQENNSLSGEAIQTYLTSIKESDAWQLALLLPSPADIFAVCQTILQREIWWDNVGDYDRSLDPDDLLEFLRDKAQLRHQQHAGEVHRSLGRLIGLVSRRGTNKYRYAPTDSFLKTLIFATVPLRMELKEFFQLLFERYGLVFSEREAVNVIAEDEFDPKPFAANAARLELRLASLGLLRRLSDGCAYVINPHGHA
ncbi:hypothetical protein [Spirosoma radiotolerans]|uniref:Uncharacterized protein n=1 Tax=Spirosoma radiotolerans TaxID=1379870 RepID=A0A0E3V8Q2_9BACT|nr:hypothetical protein [Spirosoma radiotolerans]AKD56967.1 hypothetical protein SD10_20730 [Spirosoma radiotolerans]